MPAAPTVAEHTRTFPVANCDVAPENARHGRAAVNVEALAANIKEHGLLQPLIGYELKGRTKIVAGARRLAALKAAGIKVAPVMIRDRRDAIALSISENDQRVAMHPAEEAKAWAGMIAKGGDLKAIANAFGKSEDFVRQRAALAALHPPIFAALAADKITLAIAEVYASAPAERQAALFKRFGLRASRYLLRDELAKGRLQGDDRLAKFVGQKAYIAAGGRVERDLFARSQTLDEDGCRAGDDDECDEIWPDRAIAEKLAAEKIKAEVDKLKAEGWGFVEHGEHFPYGKLSQITPGPKTEAAKKKAGAYITLERNGAMKIVRGVSKTPTKHGGYGQRVKASTVKPIGGKAGPSKTAPAMTNMAHETASRVASRVIGRAMMQAPRLAIVALCAQFARRRWGLKEGNGYTNQDVLDIQLNSDFARERGRQRKPLALKSDATLASSEHLLGSQMKAHAGDLETWLAAQEDSYLMGLFGYLVGQRVHVIEESLKDAANHKPRRAKLQALAQLAGADPADHWSPDKAWLMGLRLDMLTKIARELGITPPAGKGKLAAAIAAAARDKRWVPPLVIEILAYQKRATARAKPAVAAKKKRAA